MSKFIINGNRTLNGEVHISGSKNAALPIIFATIVTGGVSTLTGVADIGDVRVALELLCELGADVVYRDETLIIDTRYLKYKIPTDALVSKIRASSYLLGANLSRFGKCHIQSFGGCNFDLRPIDMHIYAMNALGASSVGDSFFAKELIGADIRFKTVSVGATVNAILLSVGAKGKTRIYGYAKEPHVISLIDFLRAAGADITLYDDRIEVASAELHGASAKIIPDMIEAGTYVALSLLTDSKLTVSGIEKEHLESFFCTLAEGGACFDFTENSVTAYGGLDSFLNVVTEAYPGFPTDLQPQIAPLLAHFFGGRITERVWQGRFGYLSELSKFGIGYDICASTATVRKSRIMSACAAAPDLRGGAALLMCALLAKGDSVIESAEIIKRGYSDIVNKLRQIGADIKELEDT